MVCLKTPGLTVRTSTLLSRRVWRKLVLLGIQEMAADVVRILVARKFVGPRGASLPTTMVQPASGEDLLLAPTVRTEILWTVAKS